jgi:coenzyme F420-0:L-glutamate ligase/coenzyme F420-1:gamma-L-glutamate ligase
MDEVDFWRLLQDRRSVRRYKTRPIPGKILEKILTAATWAPSAHNCEPWRFCVITREPAKVNLSRVMGRRWRQDLLADGAYPAYVDRRIQISHARITGAAALVLPCVTMAGMDDYPDPRRADAERIMAIQSVALACQNLLLAAHHYGLGACWMCAPLFAPERVQDTLQLPDDWSPQALITLGYPVEDKGKDRSPGQIRVVWR